MEIVLEPRGWGGGVRFRECPPYGGCTIRVSLRIPPGQCVHFRGCSV